MLGKIHMQLYFCKKWLAVTLCASLSFGLLAETARSSTWNPTLLVNTEAFQVIHEGDSTTDIDLRFGDTVNEKLYWDRTNSEFRFSDDLRIDGNITASGTLTVSGDAKTKGNLGINSDDGAANAVLTFGNDDTAQTLTFIDAAQKFSFSKDTRVLGNLSGSTLNVDGNAGIYGGLTVSGATTLKSTLKIGGVTYTFPTSDGSATGKVLKTSGAGVLSWSSDIDTGGTAGQGITVAGTVISLSSSFSGSSLEITGTASGDHLHATRLLTASGTVRFSSGMTLNEDADANDVGIVFGSDTTNESLSWVNLADRFEFSDDLHTTGNLTSSGTLTINSAATLKSTLKIGGVTYTFPTSDGAASGQVLKTNAAGTLSWASMKGSGELISLHPEYPNTMYFGSGSNNVGTLTLRVSSGSEIGNTYRWETTRTTNQNYWMQVRARLPDTFTNWEATPIQLRYRTMSGYIATYMRDTAGTAVALTNGTNIKTDSTSWTTASIPGPQAAGTWTGGGYFTFLLRLTNSGAVSTSPGRSYTDIGFLNFNMGTKLQ